MAQIVRPREETSQAVVDWGEQSNSAIELFRSMANSSKTASGISAKERKEIGDRLVALLRESTANPEDVTGWFRNFIAKLTPKQPVFQRVSVPPESAVWESVGGRFRDDGSESLNQLQRSVALDTLHRRSIIGDIEMAKTLGVDRTRISQKVKEKSLYAYDSLEGRCFPQWQLADGKPIRELKTLLAALDPGLHPLTVTHWVESPNTDIEINGVAVSPVDWLKTGGSVEPLVELAVQL
jgi:hypothetical protein